jgi:cold shock CspA family protein
MSGEYFYGTARKVDRTRIEKPLRPTERHGTLTTGRIVKLLVGQGHGFIRVAADREIYFHRADVQEGTSINDLDIGDAVQFELFEDTVSGGRALRVRRHEKRR